MTILLDLVWLAGAAALWWAAWALARGCARLEPHGDKR